MILSGGLLLTTCLFLTIFLELNPSNGNSYTDGTLPLYIKFLLVPLLLAPISEEILFRGFLSKSNWIKTFFFLIGLISIFLFDFDKLTLFFITVTYVLYAYFLYTNKEFLLNLIILLSAIIFALVHYPLDEMHSLETLPFLLGKFSLALILSWIVYNKGIFAGIFSHALWNLIVILFFLHSLQYVDKKQIVSDFEESIITYEKVPLFSSNLSSYRTEDKQLTAKNMTVVDVMKFMDKRYLDTFNISSPYMRYNIHVSLKSVNEKEKLNSIVIRLFEKERLIIRRDSSSILFINE